MTREPAGTLTFVLTDVVGSTRLWEQHGAAMTAALQRHDALIEESVTANGGRLIRARGEGDSRFAVFGRASDAIRAALGIQMSLSAEPWALPQPVQVRLGVFSGEVEAPEGGYYGATVNRCARLRDLAAGGQILLSQVTVELAGGDLPDGCVVRELGTYPLRELEVAERVYQLVHPRLSTELPPRGSSVYPPHNLGSRLTAFIGRQEQLAALASILAETRIVTLTGAGGIGKTRLALRLAESVMADYRDGVWTVELAALADPALVPQTVATVLGVREQPGRPVLDCLLEALRARRLLLVVDNCDHLVEACAALVLPLLQHCPELHIVATSREVLGVAGETVWRIPALILPSPAADADPTTVAASEAGALFLDRARAVLPGFALTSDNAGAVSSICRRLDGLPLAIELAAARVRMLSPQQIHTRLDARFRLLVGGARAVPTRQKTLIATLDWSYELLSAEERRLFRRLAVFWSGWRLDAAEAVAGDPAAQADVVDVLSRLVDKSLIVAEHAVDGETRFRMLETVRQYGRLHLAASGEQLEIERRHALYLLDLTVSSEELQWGPRALFWQKLLHDELDDLRAALRWLIANGEIDLAQTMGGALARFWRLGNLLTEGRAWLGELLSLSDARDSAVYSKMLVGAGLLAAYQADFLVALEMLQQAAAVCRRVGDGPSLALALFGLGTMAWLRGDCGQAQTLADEGVATSRAVPHAGLEAVNLFVGAVGALDARDLVGARTRAETIMRVSEARGFVCGVGLGLSALGRVAYYQGDLAQAEQLFKRAFDAFQDADYALGELWSIAFLAWVATAQGDVSRARRLFAESVTRSRQLGLNPRLPWLLEGLAQLAHAEGEPTRAVSLAGAASEWRRRLRVLATPADVAELEAWLPAAQAALGDTSADAWTHGRELSLDQAVELALRPVVQREPVGST